MIRAKLHDLVETFNQCGHDLRLYEPPAPGAISYRDDVEDNSGYCCSPRLAVDTVVSIGFQDTIDYFLGDEENPQK